MRGGDLLIAVAVVMLKGILQVTAHSNDNANGLPVKGRAT